jgi:hypothetical protein
MPRSFVYVQISKRIRFQYVTLPFFLHYCCDCIRNKKERTRPSVSKNTGEVNIFVARAFKGRDRFLSYYYGAYFRLFSNDQIITEYYFFIFLVCCKR